MNVGIIGGTGYTGGELLRLLYNHPKVDVTVVTSRRLVGKEVWKVHRYLKGFYELKFVEPDIKNLDECEIVFTAVPHGEAMNYVPDLLEVGIKVVDLSADYRLDRETYEKVYGLKHERFVEAVYGLTEIHKEEIAKANMVANPGCYPTGCVLAVAPIAELIDRVVFDCKSGITGAGARATDFTHYPNLHESVVPYRVTNHRHYYEIIQELRRFKEDVKVSFTPHVFPGSRGILTTAHAFLEHDIEDPEKIYEDFYRDCYFIRIQDEVKLSYVRGSNFCDVAVFLGEDRVVAISAIDNLVKGASGQAVQNMNVMMGWDEKLGLDFPPIFP